MTLVEKFRIHDTSPSTPRSATQAQAKALRQKLLGGSLTLLAGSGLVGVANLVYNVITARMLGPTGFAHVTAVYTLLMLASAITLSFQAVCAKYVASHESQEDKAAIFTSLHLRSWIASIGLGLLLFLFNRVLAKYLNLPDPILISLLAIGTAFYIPLGVRRGYIQGVHAFRSLSVNFMVEGLVRLGGAYLLIQFGLGVTGAVVSSVIAVVAAYFLAGPHPSLTLLPKAKIPIASGEGVQAIVFFAGQGAINNFDIVLMNHFFIPAQAGIYAAVSLVGRLINMFVWSVVNTMFPVSAAARSSDREARPVLFMSLGMVSLLLTVLILGL
jgi:O-antigen/teichoic acid export membrane protein